MRLLYTAETKRYILLIITLAVIAYGVFETAIGYLQLFGMIPSGNSRFPVTGSFFNPGPYCGFLACILPLAVDAVISRRWKVSEYIGWGYIILSVVMMPLLMGRTGWVAAAAGIIFVWLRENDNLLKFKNLFHRRRGCIIALAVAVVIFISLFYLLKPASASGRVFLWMTGVDAWLEHPWTGVGWERVAGAMGMAQERYFTEHPDSVFAAVAGCPEYAFNEYLQLAIAFGAGGLLLFLVLVSAGIYFSSKSRLNGVAGSWIAFAIVCMASYPLQFAEFRWLIVTFSVMTVIGLNEGSRKYSSLGRASVKGIFCVSIVFAGWSLTKDMTRTNDKSRDYFDVGQSLRRIGKFEEANKQFIDGMSYSSDPMFLNMIGRDMQDMGRYEEAEKYYLRSIDRLPSRLYPRYLLARLYASPAYFSPDKFRRLYEETNLLEIKVSSPAVSDMQRELRQLNDSIKCLRLGLKSKR